MGDGASKEIRQDGDYTQSLTEFDDLCAGGDPLTILCDLADTVRSQQTFSFSDEGDLRAELNEPTVGDKYRHLARCNSSLARRVALCQTKDSAASARIIKDDSVRAYHFLDFLCSYAWAVPRELFPIVLDLAPETVRFESKGKCNALINAVSIGCAPLDIVKKLVAVADRGRTSSESIVACITLSGTAFEIATSWSAGDLSRRIDVLYYLLEAGGTSKEILCSRRDGQYLLMHSVVVLLQEITERKVAEEYEYEEEAEEEKEMAKDLLFRVASKTFQAWNGKAAPSMLFAMVWCAQYMTRWFERRGELGLDGRDFAFDIAVDNDLLAVLLPALIEQDPSQLKLTDGRGNSPLHAAAGLNCRLLNSHRVVSR